MIAPKPHIARVYRDMDSEVVLANADALRELTATHGWRVLTEALHIQREALVDRLVKGGVKDHVTYAYTTGKVAGLALTEEILEAILKVAQETRRSLAAERGRPEED